MTPLSPIFSMISPLLIATARAIQVQDGTANALSCLVLSDLDLTDCAAAMACLPAEIFVPCTSYTLAEFRLQGFTQRYDLAVIVLPPTATLSEFSDMVVLCRDLSARHCLVIAPATQNLTAFGFAKVDFYNTNEQTLSLENTLYHAWQFNLFDYKQLPDWFNSRFWANPENWNKFRW